MFDPNVAIARTFGAISMGFVGAIMVKAMLEGSPTSISVEAWLLFAIFCRTFEIRGSK